MTSARPCPKCGAAVVMTPARLKHGKYACNQCSNLMVAAWVDKNRPRANAASTKRTRAWQKRNPGKLPTASAKRSYDRTHRLKQKYGLTPEEYNDLLVGQGHACAICRSTEPRSMFDQWHIDHCHDTGVVRGLLCARCNLGLGCLGDTPEQLERAKQYLLRSQEVSRERAS